MHRLVHKPDQRSPGEPESKLLLGERLRGLWSKRFAQHLLAHAPALVAIEAVVRHGLPDALDMWNMLGRLVRAKDTEGRPEYRLLRLALRQAATALERAFDHVVAYEELKPVLERALNREDVTAWVAGNDHTAELCFRFLRSRGRRIPRDISVVGFDDTFEALVRGLTSYNFNVAGVAHAMLNRILHPPSPRERTPIEPVEVDGFLTKRQSSGRADGRQRPS